MNFDQLHKTDENHRLEFKESFGRETVETVVAFCNASGGTILIGVDKNGRVKGLNVTNRNKLLAEAFYLRGDIEKFGTGFYRIQAELKSYPEIRFDIESLNDATKSRLIITPQDTPQDTHQDAAQDAAQVRDLIINMEEEMTREEIQKSLGLTHRENFRLLYLRPALESGLIEMTIPGKPNSKHQKYRLTSKAKQIKNNM